jgi:hypothetical protein
MKRVLKRGGIIFIEDGDLSSGGSVPPSALDQFGGLFDLLGPKKGVDYRLGGISIIWCGALALRMWRLKFISPHIRVAVNELC